MSNIAEKAKRLLDDKLVDVVIGYELGKTGKPRPAFITDSSKTDKLIFNENCTQNLAVYLTKKEVKKMGEMGIVATLPVMRSIMVLISECQLTAENVKVIGIANDGSPIDIDDISVMQGFIEKSELGNPPEYQEKLDELNKLTPQERLEFWEKELSKCTKCYACRQACPLCYCNQCAVECNQPQWIPVKATTHGNMEWHILRAMHLAGRCISCGECGRACPLDIPIHLLTMQMVTIANSHFGGYSGTSDKMESVLSTFKPDDKDNFII
jgi:formate dehydrogenase (coenzyme F420) beta subunit